MESDLGKSAKDFWLDFNKWSITFLVIENLNGNEILFEINYTSIKEFVIDSIAEDTWILNIFLDNCFFKLVLSAESRLIGMIRNRLTKFIPKPAKESITSSPIVVKSKNVKSKKWVVGAFRSIEKLLISESKAKWSRIKRLWNMVILRISQAHEQFKQRIDSSE